MRMIPVSSSNVNSVGYENSTLYVSFHNGGTYAYYNVPETIYHGLLDAPSVGQYFARYVKGRYIYDKIG